MLGKILNITSFQNPIIKDLTKIIRSNNQKEIKSFICEGNFFLKSAFENKWEIQTLVINSDISFRVFSIQGAEIYSYNEIAVPAGNYKLTWAGKIWSQILRHL